MNQLLYRHILDWHLRTWVTKWFPWCKIFCFDICQSDQGRWLRLILHFCKILTSWFFSLTYMYKSLRFFLSIVFIMSNIFFQCRILLFPRTVYILAGFSPSKSVCNYTFFWNHPYDLLKSQIIIVGHENPPNICSVDRLWFVNHFWLICQASYKVVQSS